MPRPEAQPVAASPSLIGRRLGGRLQQDVLWNLASVGVVGLSGIALNVLVAALYADAAVLGAFNQVYAVYIFASQLAAGGVHLSTLRYVARRSARPEACRTIIASAWLLTVALSTVCTAAFWACRGLLGGLLASPDVATGIAWATPGLFCFGLNKTLFAMVNGLRRMRLYAVAQALRGVMYVVGIVAVYLGRMPGSAVPVVLTLSEGVVLIVLLVANRPWLWPRTRDGLGAWMHVHFRFGVRSFGSGLLLELNTRVDVLILGYFCTDAIVGVYSFAAVLVEGLAQLPIVLRTNINPLLAQYLARREDAALAELVRKGRRYTYLAMAAVGLVTVALYPLGVALVTNQGAFRASWSVFAVLMFGLCASAGYLPFNQILLQSGHPGTHTLMTLAIVGFNALGNAALVPLWQVHGAAIATALAFVFSVLLLRSLAARCAGVRL